MLRFIIPGKPLSLNHAYVNLPGRGRAPTAALEDMHQRVLYGAAAGGAVNKQLSGPIQARLTMYFPSDRADLDNHFKPIFDGLQRARVLGNDRQVAQIYAERHIDKSNQRIEMAVGPAGLNPYEQIAMLEHQVRELMRQLEARAGTAE